MAKTSTLKVRRQESAAQVAARQAQLDPTAFDNFDAYVAAVKESQNRSTVPSRILVKLRDKYNTAVDAENARVKAQQESANPGGNIPFVTPPDTSTAKTPPPPPAAPTVSTNPAPKKKQPTIADMGSSTVSGGVTKVSNGIPIYNPAGGNVVGGEGSFEMKSQVADPQAWARTMQQQASAWRAEPSPVGGFKNKLDYIQALVRASGSGGVTERGVLDNNDLTYIKDMAKLALVNGTSFENLLVNTFQARKNGTGAGASFSKSIYSASQLLDYNDAVEKFSDGYFNTYAAYPNIAQIKQFKDYWNANATKQAATTVTTTTTSAGAHPLVGGAKGSTTSQNVVTTGAGFTQEEQAQAMASFLSAQFGKQVKDVQDLGGTALTAYNQIVQLYRNNYQDVPSFQELAPVITDLIATPEKDTYQVKLDNLARKIRGVTATAYPAASEWLNNGNDLNAIGDQRLSILATKWGTTKDLLAYDKEAQDLIKNSFNYKDKNGNSKIADNSEFNSMVQGTARYQAGPEAQAWFSGVADKVLNVIGRG